MNLRKASTGIEFEIVEGLQGAEEITDFRQTSSCFNAHEVNPALGCDFFCRYCSMYAQFQEESHQPLKVYKDYPEYLYNYIRNHPDKSSLIFNFSPKTDVFSPCLIESGVTEELLRIFRDTGVRYYILTKGGLPPESIQKLLIEARDHNQIIISSGLPDEHIEKVLEPGAPSTTKRLEFGKFCIENGVTATGIVAPYLPIGDDEEYAYKIFKRYKDAGIVHMSIQILKLSMECLERLCKLLPEYEGKLRELYNLEDSLPIAWRLPGGQTVTRYYANTAYLSRELGKLKQVARSLDMTISACKDVCININDLSFNDEGLKRGFNCVGFTKF